MRESEREKGSKTKEITFTAHLPQIPEPPQLSNLPGSEYTSILFFCNSLRKLTDFSEPSVTIVLLSTLIVMPPMLYKVIISNHFKLFFAHHND